jgi:uridine kinase
MTPFLIGVAGPSGAGKSELSRLLAARLPGPASLISLDSYYQPFADLAFDERTRINFDHPSALDWDLVQAHLELLRCGEAIDEPGYSFERYSRATETRRVEPTPYVIVEGLFALYDRRIRALYDARIFVSAPDELCLTRRLARDTVERGRTPQSVFEQYETTVRPMAERFVLPTEQFADLVVSGSDSLEHLWSLCRDLLLQPA